MSVKLSFYLIYMNLKLKGFIVLQIVIVKNTENSKYFYFTFNILLFQLCASLYLYFTWFCSHLQVTKTNLHKFNSLCRIFNASSNDIPFISDVFINLHLFSWIS